MSAACHGIAFGHASGDRTYCVTAAVYDGGGADKGTTRASGSRSGFPPGCRLFTHRPPSPRRAGRLSPRFHSCGNRPPGPPFATSALDRPPRRKPPRGVRRTGGSAHPHRDQPRLHAFERHGPRHPRRSNAWPPTVRGRQRAAREACSAHDTRHGGPRVADFRPLAACPYLPRRAGKVNAGAGPGRGWLRGGGWCGKRARVY